MQADGENSTSQNHYSITIQQYLPRELMDIITARQHLERAWHVRLSICTSLYSNIESTLTIYKEDIEKEEAEFIKRYLQEAITCLAAANHVLKTPKISFETKPNNLKFTNRNTSKSNKSLVEAPSLPDRPPQNHKVNTMTQSKPSNQQEHSWVVVARNENKKARNTLPSISTSMANNTKPLAQSHNSSRTYSRDANQKKLGLENKQENRLYVFLQTMNDESFPQQAFVRWLSNDCQFLQLPLVLLFSFCREIKNKNGIFERKRLSWNLVHDDARFI